MSNARTVALNEGLHVPQPRHDRRRQHHEEAEGVKARVTAVGEQRDPDTNGENDRCERPLGLLNAEHEGKDQQEDDGCGLAHGVERDANVHETRVGEPDVQGARAARGEGGLEIVPPAQQRPPLARDPVQNYPTDPCEEEIRDHVACGDGEGEVQIVRAEQPLVVEGEADGKKVPPQRAQEGEGHPQPAIGRALHGGDLP